MFIKKEELHFSLIFRFYCCLVKEGLALKVALQIAIRGLVAYKPVAYKINLKTDIFENFILEKQFRYVYVDDLATCFNNEKSAFSFYENLKSILALGKFDLYKWFTKQLQDKIWETETTENDQYFDVSATKKILGVNWDLHKDRFVFTFDVVVSCVIVAHFNSDQNKYFENCKHFL